MNVIHPLIRGLRAVGVESNAIACPQDEEELLRTLPQGVEYLAVDAPFIRWREPRLHEAIDRWKPDLYFTTNYSYDPTVTIPVIPTVHDLIRVKWPELTFNSAAFNTAFGPVQATALSESSDFMRTSLGPDVVPALSGDLFHDYFRLMNSWIAVRTRHIVTVSESSAADLRQILGVSSERVSVARCGVSPDFRPRTGCAARKPLERLLLHDSYVVTVGQTSPGKRLSWLIDSLLPVLKRETPLVVVGEYALNDERIVGIAESSAGKVRLVGRLSDSELAAIYSLARSYVTASVAEGYGLPAQEALACGTQVICTDIPVFRETLGSLAAFYEPHDAERLRSLVGAALDGQESMNGGKPVSAPSDWKETARVIGNAITEVLREHQSQTGRPR